MLAWSGAVVGEGWSCGGPMSFPTRGRQFMGCHSRQPHTQKSCVFGAFLLPTFLWQGRPEGSPLGGQRKVGAAPHRGNANRPKAKQGKAKKQEQGKAKQQGKNQEKQKQNGATHS